MHLNAHVNRDTHTHACRIHIREITQSHTCSHTLPPLLPWPHTPSLPHSPKRRELVKDARRQFADRIAAQLERPGTRRGGSQPSHTPLAHARFVHQHGHACAPCPRAMHMHVCLSLSLWICAHRACLCACACASSHVYNISL